MFFSGDNHKFYLNQDAITNLCDSLILGKCNQIFKL